MVKKKDEWSACPHIKDISNNLIGEMALKEAYKHPLNNISTMRCPQEEKHINGNEHITQEITKGSTNFVVSKII